MLALLALLVVFDFFFIIVFCPGYTSDAGFGGWKYTLMTIIFRFILLYNVMYVCV